MFIIDGDRRIPVLPRPSDEPPINRCLFGDCRVSMRQLIDNGIKVQTVVTSPPYFGLRDYGVPGQFGLEKTPAEYVANLVDVFRLVRELLHEDGTVWLNLGDSYATQPGKGNNVPQTKWKSNSYPEEAAHRSLDVGVSPKNLLGIPWRVAFALQEDGWFLRQDIIWHKPNPMPESVKDRCTRAHEYLFLLTQSPRYYFDSEAMKEPAIYQPGSRPDVKKGGFDSKYAGDVARKGDASFRAIREMRNKRSVWTVATKPYPGAHFACFPEALVVPCILSGSRLSDTVFDPFLGSGTTAMAAKRHGRNWLGCELNPKYSVLQQQRLTLMK